MTRQARILTPVLLAMVVLSGCFGCEEDKPIAPNTVFFVPPDPVTLDVGQTKTVAASVIPFTTSGTQTDLGTTTYASSDGSIATVDAKNGLVTCVAPGSVTITATNVNKAGT